MADDINFKQELCNYLKRMPPFNEIQSAKLQFMAQSDALSYSQYPLLTKQKLGMSNLRSPSCFQERFCKFHKLFKYFLPNLLIQELFPI